MRRPREQFLHEKHGTETKMMKTDIGRAGAWELSYIPPEIWVSLVASIKDIGRLIEMRRQESKSRRSRIGTGGSTVGSKYRDRKQIQQAQWSSPIKTIAKICQKFKNDWWTQRLWY